MENKLLTQSIYYCLPGEESHVLSILLHDEEFERQLWEDACRKFDVETEAGSRAEREANKSVLMLNEKLMALEKGKELSDLLFACESRLSDEGMAFASEMFIRGLIYGFVYLGQALHDRINQTNKLS